MKKTVELNMHPLFGILLMLVLVLFSGCEKSATLPGPVYEAEVYILGYDPCIEQGIINTPLGKGEVYFVETIGTTPDTVFLFNVPANLVRIPEEWHGIRNGSFLPEEREQKLKMHITYQILEEKIPIICKANVYWPPIFHNRDDYIVIKAKMID